MHNTAQSNKANPTTNSMIAKFKCFQFFCLLSMFCEEYAVKLRTVF